MLVIAPSSRAQDLHSLASTISQRIAGSGRKSVGVIDFTDLDGKPTRLGRYLAEEFSDSLVSASTNFDVIDRTHLKSILDEHKLATSGLIDPATMRELGKITGVETLVTGTLTPFEETVHLSVKVLDSQTAKVIGASTADIPKTKTIIDLLAGEVSVNKTSASNGGSPGTASKVALPPAVLRDDLSFLTRGCQLKATSLRCTFGITNKAQATRRVWFTEASFVDDQGRQTNRLNLDFASKTEWLNHTTDLIPEVPVNLILEAANFPDSASSVTVQISYGVQ